MDGQSQLEHGSDPHVGADEGRRVEELLRVNARLAAEVRSLGQGRTGAPRSASTTSSRRLGALIDERDTLRERLESADRELAALREHREALERDRDALAVEVQRLRGGWQGIARRVRARLTRRR